MNARPVCTAAVLLLGSFASAPAQEPESSDPVWHEEFARAKQIARQTERPLFVVFR